MKDKSSDSQKNNLLTILILILIIVLAGSGFFAYRSAVDRQKQIWEKANRIDADFGQHKTGLDRVDAQIDTQINEFKADLGRVDYDLKRLLARTSILEDKIDRMINEMVNRSGALEKTDHESAPAEDHPERLNPPTSNSQDKPNRTVVSSKAQPDAVGIHTEWFYRIRIRADFGSDRGQNWGSLFEAYDQEGRAVMGAGFAGVCNTGVRDPRELVRFWVRPPQTSAGLTRLDPDEQPEDLFNPAQLVAGRPLKDQGHHLQWGEHTIYRTPEGFSLACPYYALGRVLFWEYQDQDRNPSLLKTLAWSPQTPEELGPETSYSLEAGEFPYSYGQLAGRVLVATNRGRLLAFDGRTWTEVLPLAEKARQFYAMLNWKDVLLLGQYPDGVIWRYDGRDLQPMPDWPPHPPQAMAHFREVQSLNLYRGELWAGVWPWGELYHYNGSDWRLAWRAFSSPAIRPDLEAPFEIEASSAGLVLNSFGQRIAGLTARDGALYLKTTPKSIDPAGPRPEILFEPWRSEYDAVVCLTESAEAQGRVGWTDGPTELEFLIYTDRLEIRQDGRRIGRVEGELVEAGDLPVDQVAWGRGVFGPSRVHFESARMDSRRLGQADKSGRKKDKTHG